MRAGGMQTPRLGAAAGGGYVVGCWIALRAMADVVIGHYGAGAVIGHYGGGCGLAHVVMRHYGAGAGGRVCDGKPAPGVSCAATGQPPRDPSPRVRHSCLPSSQATVT